MLFAAFLLFQSKTIDLRLKIVPLSEAVTRLSEASGIPLEASPPVADRKITLLVREADPRATMDRIAEVMRLRWEAKGDGYRLTTDPTLEGRESAQLAAELNARQAVLKGRIGEWALEGATSPEEKGKEIDRLRKTMQALKAESPEWNAVSMRVGKIERALASKDLPLASALAALGDEGRKRLLAGEAFVFGAGQRPAGIRLPSYLLDRSNDMFTQPESALRLTMFVRVVDAGTRLQVVSRKILEDGSYRGSSGTFDEPTSEPTPTKTGFADELAAWNQKTLAGPEAGRRIDGSRAVRTSRWCDRVRTQSDALEWLHDATGVSVVARADRRRWFIPPRFDGTVQAFADRWRGEDPGTGFRLSGGFLMERPTRYWQAKAEPSEAVLGAFEAIERPSASDWADLASTLSDAQIEMLRLDRLATRLSMRPLEEAPALRFWATLRKDQRAKALRGALGADDLSKEQAGTFLRSVLDAADSPRFDVDLAIRLIEGDRSAFVFDASGAGYQTLPSGESVLAYASARFGPLPSTMRFSLPREPVRG